MKAFPDCYGRIPQVVQWWRTHLPMQETLEMWIKKILCRQAWQPTPVFLSGESPWTEDPGGLLFMGLHRVGWNWSNLECMHMAGSPWPLQLACPVPPGCLLVSVGCTASGPTSRYSPIFLLSVEFLINTLFPVWSVENSIWSSLRGKVSLAWLGTQAWVIFCWLWGVGGRCSALGYFTYGFPNQFPFLILLSRAFLLLHSFLGLSL